AWAAAQGAHNSRERAVAALLTRADKGDVTAEATQTVWAAQHAEYPRFSADGLLAERVQERGDGEPHALLRREVLRRLWAEGPAVSVGALRSIAFELVPRVGLSLTEAESVLAQMQAEGELITLDGWRVTSRD